MAGCSWGKASALHSSGLLHPSSASFGSQLLAGTEWLLHDCIPRPGPVLDTCRSEGKLMLLKRAGGGGLGHLMGLRGHLTARRSHNVEINLNFLLLLKNK